MVGARSTSTFAATSSWFKHMEPAYLYLVAGIYFLALALGLDTKNLLSMFIFRLFPGLFGTLQIIFALKSLGLL